MQTIQNSLYLLPPTPSQKRSRWKLPLLILTLPFTLLGGFVYTLTQYIVTNISLQASGVRKQKIIQEVYPSRDAQAPEIYVINLRKPVQRSARKNYWNKFKNTLFNTPLYHNELDHLSNDAEHIARVIQEIKQRAQAPDWDWSKVYFKGSESLDETLKAVFFSRLATIGYPSHPPERKHTLNFFTLRSADGVLLDSVEILNSPEQEKPISERKFIIRCLVRKENFIQKIKDAWSILEKNQAEAPSADQTFVYFNWRGSDYSTGKVWSPKDMVQDVIAQVQRLIALGAKPENIGLTGTSLGAAIATLSSAKLHEAGINVKEYNERSFRSYLRVIVGYFLPAANSSPWNPINWGRYALIGFIYVVVGPAVWLSDWTMDVIAAWKKIPEEDKDYCVIHDSDDLLSKTGKEDGSLDDHHTTLYSYIVEERKKLEKKRDAGISLTEEEEKFLQDDLHRHYVTLDPAQASSVKANTPPHILNASYFVQLKDHTKKLYDLMSGYFRKQLGQRPINDDDIIAKFLGKKYQYNPHRHVKIWMSNNPDVFMNFENQTRLVEMRQKNKDDEISLVYSSSLLTPKAQEELKEFCRIYAINAVDADTDEFKASLHSELEPQLYEHYKDEIRNHREGGGSLSVASDILRWLSPIYQLGTYSDFDYPIDTSKLPTSIEVDAPILINLGSFGISGQQIIISNNDFIAIVDGDAGAKKIHNIQQAILKNLNSYKSTLIDEIEETFKKVGPISHRLIFQMEKRLENAYHRKSNDLKEKSGVASSREVRKYLKEVMSDQQKYLDFQRKPNEKDDQIVSRLKAELKKNLGLISWLFFSREYYEIKNMLAQSTPIFLQMLMKKERDFYLKAIVVNTTGISGVAHGLFGTYTCENKRFDTDVQRFSIQYYGLEKAFQSRNIMGLQENIIRTLKFLADDEGDHNDSSWLEAGAEMLKKRGNVLVMQQAVLAKQLPQRLTEIKEKLENYHAQLIEKQSKWVYSAIKSKLTHQINAVNEVLACFATGSFNGESYDQLIIAQQSKQVGRLDKLLFKRGQTLFHDLESVHNEAASCFLAVHQSVVSLSSPASILEALSIPNNDLLLQLSTHLHDLRSQGDTKGALVEALETLYQSAEEDIAAKKSLGWTDRRIIQSPSYAVLQETIKFLTDLKQLQTTEAVDGVINKQPMLEAIKSYDCRCYELTRRSSLEKAVKMVIVAAIGVVLGIVIGGALGLAAGIWTGPGAIVSTLLGLFQGAYTGASLGLAVGAGLSGAAVTKATSSYTSLFKPHFMHGLSHTVALECNKSVTVSPAA